MTPSKSLGIADSVFEDRMLAAWLCALVYKVRKQ